jgi:UDP-N-acetylmuramate dehydrogenase
LPRAINDAAKGPGSRLGQALPGQALRRFEQAELRTRNTFGVAALAPLLVEVGDAAELPRAFAPGWAGADAMVLGGGSNGLFAADPPCALR